MQGRVARAVIEKQDWHPWVRGIQIPDTNGRPEQLKRHRLKRYPQSERKSLLATHLARD
jgi:hypothetical protein